jgi:23S rRNA pseudouridine1911/1915/1917 synthase
MAAIGCPLVGDKLYGHGDEIFLEHLRGELSEENKEKLVLDRHALHSWRLRFFHPERDDEMEIEASLPQDMEGLLD